MYPSLILAVGFGLVTGPVSAGNPEPVPAPNQPAAATVIIRQDGIDAFWNYSDSSGCVVTSVQVSGAFQTLRHADGTTEIIAPHVYASVTVYDVCNFVTIHDTQGDFDASVWEINPGLGSAHVVAKLPSFDGADLSSFYTYVDLTWVATGPPQVDGMHSAGSSGVLNAEGTARPCVATGSVVLTDLGNYAIGDSTEAALFKTSANQISVTK